MKYACPLIAVKDLKRSRSFYEEVMRQGISLDLGGNLSFGEGANIFAIQLDYEGLVNTPGFHIDYKANDHELVFEEENFDAFEKHLEGFADIVYLHKTKEYPWGQRVVRFYDPDFHIIEVGESMESVFHKFHKQGMTIEEVAERTGHPLEYVKQYLV